ncbi:heavy-metal-associated domain-containing protein [Clostridium sp. NSJ-6]|uniref:Heavy-metal-associated domain-containing protein n=1 Tax=Clostridium hominis TaxID=2763036 RepID=A0ABR7DH52_9CLOT|nr:heavy metal-associated domain-containing protein [Clostridium hominis]MBC5630750.1 heavy-metal-associated domain-containing protein [Clostridium hominis]MDU2672087.1 heavy metal-associated domain-containing protein [Clostridium sp.]
MLKKISIEGMSCNKCVAHVKEALEELKDAKSIEVNLEGKYANVDTTSNDEEIREKIDDAGYDVISIDNL